MRAGRRIERLTSLVYGLIVIGLAGACGGARTQGGADPDAVDSGAPTGTRQSGTDETGAVSVIRDDELTAMRGARIEDVIASRVPGLEVVSIPGGYSFRIRGANSFSGSGEPLCVLDGVPIRAGGISAALASLQPRDLARVEVLRDAAASSYGPRGANGVILITTKRRRPPGD